MGASYCRDGEKTQSGIETQVSRPTYYYYYCRDGEKTQSGIETAA